jgi:hypothetical protein
MNQLLSVVDQVKSDDTSAMIERILSDTLPLISFKHPVSPSKPLLILLRAAPKLA